LACQLSGNLTAALDLFGRLGNLLALAAAGQLSCILSARLYFVTSAAIYLL
jgi:hypothetical protein